MVGIEFARNEIKQMYKHNQGWKRKVDKMPDNQVLAIYNREFVNKPKKSKEEKEESGEDIPF